MSKVTVTVSSDGANPKFTTRTAFVNGVRYEVKLDEQVEMPTVVNEVLRDSIKASQKFNARKKKGLIVDRGDEVREF